VERVLRLRREIAGFAADLTALAAQTEGKGDASVEARTELRGLERDMGALLSDGRIAPYLAHNFTATHLLSGDDPVLHAAMDAAYQGEGFALSLNSTAGVRTEALAQKIAAVEAAVGTNGQGGQEGDLRTRLATLQVAHAPDHCCLLAPSCAATHVCCRHLALLTHVSKHRPASLQWSCRS
jgi:hypothetical protein